MRAPRPKLLVATGNAGKLAEYRVLLGDLPCQIIGLWEAGITLEVEEAGATYHENACLKAEAYAQASGLLTLADDSGLEVDALGGAPGPLSARYGGPGLTDPQRAQLLLANLSGVAQAQRTARFVCVIAIAGSGMETRLVQGECRGTITTEPRGDNGFGYDPVFLVPELGRTLAELSASAKDAVSHRGNAARAARRVLEERRRR
ncbi:MAG: RdgB/HAM1 family non-canonical purine NTP pyrophosphatase [Chloroflexi bacterium]|nr:RdgB/HAM1 family non-canonical purine NTP pyrophosphatase [Chloroflexota bacterium]